MLNFILPLLIIFASYNAFSSEITEVDFDYSMGISNQPRYNLLLKDGKKSEELLNFYRNLYNRNKPSELTANKNPRVPKIIHQIWIGPAPYPKLYQKYRDICLALHPDWEYKLWTDKDVENWDFANKDLYNKSVTYQEKADILRYEILYKHGGLYLDTDYICLAKFDELNYLYDFYAGLEPPYTSFTKPVISNALIGTKPNNHIFPLLFEKIRGHWEDKYFKELNTKNHYLIPQYRTMQPLTDVIYEINPQEPVIVFPSTYFMPLYLPTAKSDYSIIDQINLLLGIYHNVPNFTSIRLESLAIQDVFETYISPPIKK
jgi:hypothetical protein